VKFVVSSFKLDNMAVYVCHCTGRVSALSVCCWTNRVVCQMWREASRQLWHMVLKWHFVERMEMHAG